jgi:phosphotransferase system enzyme I (PtsI)
MKSDTVIFRGISASYGKFYGKALKIISSNHIILESKISPVNQNAEITKFLRSLRKTKEELEKIIEQKSIPIDLKEILNSQIVMLDDPILIEGVTKRIKEKSENAALALFHTIDEISKQFENLDDEYLSERAVDVRDIGKRIEENLLERKSDYNVLTDLKEEVILIAHELTPSQMIHIDKSKVKGIATEMGGKTGHMAILAKNYSIPTVVGLNHITTEIEEDEFIFIDSDEGVLIKNPSISLIKYYGPKSNLKQLKKEIIQPITKDGTKILLKVNLEEESLVEPLLQEGIDGVGLYRSEALLIEDSSILYDEEKQFYSYKTILQKMKDLPVTIRTFDLGGDKFNSNEEEDNPFLGNRGIRFALRNKIWFKKQIRALLRSSIYGNLSIMLPMIVSLKEVMDTKEIIQECKKELDEQKIIYRDFKIGIMVETPACAISLDIYSKQVDFFSIGTNDLLQYTMAVDRNNPYLSDIYNPYHISFLRLLFNISENSKKFKKPFCICGELASDTHFTILLLGMGYRELSIAPPLFSKIAKIISHTDIQSAEKLVKQIFKLSRKEKYTEMESFLFTKHMEI